MPVHMPAGRCITMPEALRNVSYMVDDAELPDILANLPPCDGASDEGEPVYGVLPLALRSPAIKTLGLQPGTAD